jgi:hypothetical protein
MPQLIAMVIVVVGAMIYMFQTFGGTGDKIEGIAQKTSIITEINNIKSGIQIAAGLRNGDTGGIFTNDTLEVLAEGEIFEEQINELLRTTDNDTNNTYNALSFGGRDVVIQLVTNVAGRVPGIYVDLTQGTLLNNAGFLETQIVNDLGNIASFDRAAVGPVALAAARAAEGVDARIPVEGAIADGNERDGRFIVYFRDIPLSGATH